MARDLNARAAAYTAKKEKSLNDRHEQLEDDIVGLLHEAIAKTFPEKADGSPDWDKFDWNRAEQLKNTLTQFTGSTSQPQSPAPAAPAAAEPRNGSEQQPRRTQRPAPATPAAPAQPDPAPAASTPPAATPAPAPAPAQPQQSIWKKIGARLDR